MPDRPSYYDDVEAALRKLFREHIYLPLMRECVKDGAESLKNSVRDLIDAIGSGQITHRHGMFRGRFDSILSRELRRLGAEWDRKQGSWKVPLSKLPADIRMAIAASESRFRDMAERVNRRLQEILPEKVADLLRLDHVFDATLFHAEKDFQANVKSIGVEAKLTDDQRERIAAEYTKNMQLYVQDFTDTEILKLRQRVQGHALAGGRQEDLVKEIRDSYGVSLNKAKFLARQETRLMVTKFHQTRLEDAGVRQYKWRCVTGSPAHPVRPMHKELDGTVHFWDNPPIVDEKGNRKNPGQAYGCRCTAIPIVEF